MPSSSTQLNQQGYCQLLPVSHKQSPFLKAEQGCTGPRQQAGSAAQAAILSQGGWSTSSTAGQGKELPNNTSANSGEGSTGPSCACAMQNSSLLSEHTIVYEGFTWNHTNPGQLHTLPLACSIRSSAAGRKLSRDTGLVSWALAPALLPPCFMLQSAAS